jgi:CheY-like chemotaxis protein
MRASTGWGELTLNQELALNDPPGTRLALMPSGETLMTPHALIVDDEPAVRAMVTRVLADAGYSTTAAGSGPDALAACDAGTPFDILVTDLMMPGMAGDELSRRVRLGSPDLPVLYLTGYADRLFEERSLLWDGEAFLEKPFTRLGLEQAVELLIRPSGASRGRA